MFKSDEIYNPTTATNHKHQRKGKVCFCYHIIVCPVDMTTRTKFYSKFFNKNSNANTKKIVKGFFFVLLYCLHWIHFYICAHCTVQTATKGKFNSISICWWCSRNFFLVGSFQFEHILKHIQEKILGNVNLKMWTLRNIFKWNAPHQSTLQP